MAAVPDPESRRQLQPDNAGDASGLHFGLGPLIRNALPCRLPAA